jgi:hypothetical protein
LKLANEDGSNVEASALRLVPVVVVTSSKSIAGATAISFGIQDQQAVQALDFELTAEQKAISIRLLGIFGGCRRCDDARQHQQANEDLHGTSPWWDVRPI